MNPKEWKVYFESKEFKKNYIYEKLDLGIKYSKQSTIFQLWAPTASSVKINLYTKGSEKEAGVLESFSMTKEEKGVYRKTVEGDLHGIFYDFEVTVNGVKTLSADPYAISCGVNGKRSMVVDLEQTNPKGWKEDRTPEKTSEYQVIYELHVKDFSIDEASGISKKNRGKYLAFTETKTTLNNDGIHTTGIDYLKMLGITHVHLLPIFDFGSIDEEGSDEQFNWGYDPLNYNVPEGSYSTNPYDGVTRIKELKEMVAALHQAGICVVMDVVYNHTFSLDSWFQKTVPYYYYRQWKDGTFSNGSACGNDIASEREMCANYIKQSILYWAQEYHIDGFRFDLMGLLSIDLLNEIRVMLDRLPNGKQILMYGEPWLANKTAIKEKAELALKENIQDLDENIAIFCDDTRDIIKGHVFFAKRPGFVNGKKGLEQEIISAISAWCDGRRKWIPKSPKQIISYISAHDNYTLWDKLVETMRDGIYTKEEDRELIQVNKLAAAILFTCQGTVFFQAGEEFARTKYGDENSYSSSYLINKLDWKRAWEFRELVEYYIGLMEIRKSFTAFYNRKIENIKNIVIQQAEKGIVAFTIQNEEQIEKEWKQVFIVFNSTKRKKRIELPNGKWRLLADELCADYCKENIIKEEEIFIKRQSALILGQI